MADVTPTLPTVTAQKAKTVGDENLEVREAEVTVNSGTVKAQVSPAPEAAPARIPVNEVSVVTDVVITDPSDPLAVQVPDAGRGTLDLPIHALAGPTVEDVFDKASADAAPDETPSDA